MPPDCEDSDQTQTPERTPAFRNGFGPNTDKLGHILKFSQKATEKYTAELKTLSTGLVGLRGPGIRTRQQQHGDHHLHGVDPALLQAEHHGQHQLARRPDLRVPGLEQLARISDPGSPP